MAERDDRVHHDPTNTPLNFGWVKAQAKFCTQGADNLLVDTAEHDFPGPSKRSTLPPPVLRRDLEMWRGQSFIAPLAAVLVISASGTAAFAADFCSGVPALALSPDFQPSVATTKGKQTLLRGGDTKGCPGSGAECATRRVVPEGQPVVVVSEAGDFACAVFTTSGSKTSTMSGFLPKSGLSAVVPSTASKAADWYGNWSAGPEQSIIIKADPRGIAIEGSASWGASDPERAKRGGVNTGEIAAKLAVDGPSLTFTMGEDDETLPFTPDDESYSCGVKMWRLSAYLIVSDNGNCGGHNVTFTGAYRK